MTRNTSPVHTHTAEEAEQHPWTQDTLSAHLIHLHGIDADPRGSLPALERLHAQQHPELDGAAQPGYDPSMTLADLVAAARHQPGTGLIAREVIRSLGLAEEAAASQIEQGIRAAVRAAATAARNPRRSARFREKAIGRLYKLARTSVDNSWGSPQQVLGPVLYRALIGEELLRLCATQDETISAESIRAMAAGFWQRLRDDQEVNGS